MIDNNRDGTIDAADLKGTYASLGIMNVEDEMVNSMIKEAPAALTFTVFLGSISNNQKWLFVKMTGDDLFTVLGPRIVDHSSWFIDL